MLRSVNDSVGTLWAEEKIKTVSFLLPGFTCIEFFKQSLFKFDQNLLYQIASNLPPCQAAQKSTRTESRRGLAGPLF